MSRRRAALFIAHGHPGGAVLMGLLLPLGWFLFSRDREDAKAFVGCILGFALLVTGVLWVVDSDYTQLSNDANKSENFAAMQVHVKDLGWHWALRGRTRAECDEWAVTGRVQVTSDETSDYGIPDQGWTGADRTAFNQSFYDGCTEFFSYQ